MRDISLKSNKIPVSRFSWLEYYQKQNLVTKHLQFLYGTLFLHTREVGHYLFSSILFSKKDLVLDVGSGDGNFANWISYHSSCSVIGIEKLTPRIVKARSTQKKYNLHTKFIKQDIEINNLDYPPNTFDKVLLIDTLEHFQQPYKVLETCMKMVKKSGCIFISTPQASQSRILIKSHHEFFSYGNDHHYFSGFDINELKEIIEKRGFTVVISKSIYFGLYQIAWEMSEVIRPRSKMCYSLLLPIFSLFAILDRGLQIGKHGNGIILVAEKK